MNHRRSDYDLNLNNPPKFWIVVLALICITVLMVTGTIDADAGLGLLGVTHLRRRRIDVA